MNYCYKFPVVKGLQAGKDYYIAMVPLKMLPRLFPTEEEFILPEYRAQRRINELRIPTIKKYILDNKDSYVFSALAASIDGRFEFVPVGDTGLGILEISLDAKLLINDGQHRKAAISEVINEYPEIGDETISIVFYKDSGLKSSQQIFTDLNKHAVKTSNSIAELYDYRDPLAVATRKIIVDVPFLEQYVDKEKDILGKFSSSLFTLNNFYVANRRILKRKECDSSFEKFTVTYWSAVSTHMVPWIDMKNRSISKVELREKYIAAQAVVIQAFGRVGGYMYENYKKHPIEEHIPLIENIDWKRNADEWKLRVIKQNGRMINSERSIILATNVIKKKIHLPFTEEEQNAEEEFTNIIK